MSQWKELFSEIVATDVCCGCAACVLVCPHKVLDYDFGMEKPFQTDEERPDDCSHGIKGCTLCAQACPRLDHDAGIWRWNWPQLEEQLFGRTRNPDEIFGVAREVVVARAAQDSVVAAAQDGGIATALILHGLETGALDGAVVSGYDGKTQMTEPKLIKTAEDALATAKSRYTYAPTPLAMKEAFEQKLRKIALVGVSCEITAAPKMTYAGVRKWSNRIALTVGLMCSETFLPKPFLEQKLQGEYGIDMTKVDKINIKGKVIVTMVVVRTERGAQWWKELVDAGKVEVRPAAEEQGAYDLMGRLAKRQRRRTRNIELWLEQGKVEPWNAEEAEALHKRGTPEAAFKPGGSRNISALSQVSIAGPSPRG